MAARRNASGSRFNKNPLTLALATALMFPLGVVHAQDATEEDSQESTEEAAPTNTSTLDAVTVTGSRIAKSTFNSVSPIQVIPREESTVAGFNSTAGLLQSNAVTGGSDQINNAYGGYVVNGGPGVNTLSLRGLGPTRSLLLVNGRRLSPSGSRGAVGSVDLNTLPNIMVEHVEVLKDGASAIYGSDAVAGVVNVVTKSKFDGVAVEFQTNATQNGGGLETRWGTLFGTSGDKWRVSGSLEIYDRQEVTMGDRDWASDCPRPLLGRDDATGRYGADDYIDPTTGEPKCWGLDAGGVTINTLGTQYLLGRPGLGSLGYYGTYDPDNMPPGGFDYFNRWRPNASVTDGDLPGYEGVDLEGRTTYDPTMKRESLISPTTNVTGFLQGSMDLGVMGDAEAYFEALITRRESEQTGYLQHTVDYAVGSPLLGDLSWLPRMSAAPADGSTNGLPIAARAFIGWGLYGNRQTIDFGRYTAGLRGDLGSSWSYDGYLSYGRSDADYYTDNRLTDRIAKSYDVVSDGNGGFVCRDTSDGCVAAPVLSADVVAGNLSQAYRNYIMQETHGSTIYEEETAAFGVSGPLFDIPFGGTVAAAFGVEYRGMEIDDTPDINSINSNLYGFTSSTPTRGEDSVKEAYAEFEIPLLSGLPGAQELTFNLSGRYTDYDSYGSDDTWKLGMLWTPVDWLSLRASRGTSFRAPALFEQFLGASSGFANQSGDPCNDWGNATDTNSNTYLNCSSLGLPPNFNATNSITVYTQGGAETGLSAETSEAVTAGLVFQPEFGDGFGDLSFAADYFSIEVKNGVARLSGAQVLALCYGQSQAEFTAGSGYCSLVQRAANNSLTVTTGYINVARDKVRGWDFTTRYARDIGQGRFVANLAVTSFLEQGGQTLPSVEYKDYSGTIGAPELTGQLDLNYTIRNWRVRYGLDWVGSVESYSYYEKYDGVDYRPTYQMAIDDYFLHNLSLKYTGDDWSVTGGIRNVADKDPPVVSTGAYTTIGNAPLYSGYDYFGRTFFLNFSKEF
ncbi:TonB-dependent receptor [Pseudoxanthomonas jiangsuensis]|uniref:TonB-dependent receptor plug domain-containing protein n=1 Tax=Pseudoxanthomonas jiangsuensis TaxID=619688 RepID=UPI001391E9AD|nr:TonB-dependent receptor [Pseudoxanthomonas jiangsuensis]KAF1698944.1 TonB-dependent receptor [Pseudoxanthomonas jiangsuensis]